MKSDEPPQEFPEIYHYSGHERFKGQDEHKVAENVPALTKAKYDKMMVKEAATSRDSEDAPGMVAGLAVGTDVYYSSSLKGLKRKVAAQVLEELAEKELKDAITACKGSQNREHEFSFACAEVQVINQYLMNNPETSIHGNASISVYGRLSVKDRKSGKSSTNNTRAGFRDPCHGKSEKEWGCKHMLKKLDIDVIDVKKSAEIQEPTIIPEETLDESFQFWKRKPQVGRPGSSE